MTSISAMRSFLMSWSPSIVRRRAYGLKWRVSHLFLRDQDELLAVHVPSITALGELSNGESRYGVRILPDIFRFATLDGGEPAAQE